MPMTSNSLWRRLPLLVSAAFAVVALSAGLRAAPHATPVLDWQFDGEVHATARIGDVVYVGGDFHNVAPRAGGPSVARRSLVAFDASTGALLPATITLDPPQGVDSRSVRSLGVVGQTLYITGDFSGTVNGLPRCCGSAAFDTGVGALTAWRLDSPNRRVVLADATGIYATEPNGVVRRFDPVTGAMDPRWLPDLTANIVRADGELWASRPFPNFSLNPFQGGGTSVGVLDQVTGLFDERFRTPLLLPWHGLVVHGDTVYIAGQLPDLTLQINQPDVADSVLAFSRSTGVGVSPIIVGESTQGFSAHRRRRPSPMAGWWSQGA